MNKHKDFFLEIGLSLSLVLFIFSFSTPFRTTFGSLFVKAPNLAQVSSMQCSDGIDNDGDGLTDWQSDLGCYGPGDNTEQALSRDQENGWTTFNKSVDTRIVYVSNSA
ncbi:hypothetical protein KW783_02205, partial [Candidatus Parcubacteria bacterium]|nr:hypothetical protein [Candidatus Parcubacteria bacterium]